LYPSRSRTHERCVIAFEVDVDDSIARARALSFCGRTHADQNQVAGARECLSKAVELFATRPLGYDDPEAKVAGAWLRRLALPEDG